MIARVLVTPVCGGSAFAASASKRRRSALVPGSSTPAANQAPGQLSGSGPVPACWARHIPRGRSRPNRGCCRARPFVVADPQFHPHVGPQRLARILDQSGQVRPGSHRSQRTARRTRENACRRKTRRPEGTGSRGHGIHWCRSVAGRAPRRRRPSTAAPRRRRVRLRRSKSISLRLSSLDRCGGEARAFSSDSAIGPLHGRSCSASCQRRVPGFEGFAIFLPSLVEFGLPHPRNQVTPVDIQGAFQCGKFGLIVANSAVGRGQIAQQRSRLGSAATARSNASAAALNSPWRKAFMPWLLAAAACWTVCDIWIACQRAGRTARSINEQRRPDRCRPRMARASL